MTSAAPRYADPRAGGCGRRVDAGEGQPTYCGTRPAPLELRLGPGGKRLERLCETCGKEVRAEIARLKANGVRFRTDLVVERVEETSSSRGARKRMPDPEDVVTIYHPFGRNGAAWRPRDGTGLEIIGHRSWIEFLAAREVDRGA